MNLEARIAGFKHDRVVQHFKLVYALYQHVKIATPLIRHHAIQLEITLFGRHHIQGNIRPPKGRQDPG